VALRPVARHGGGRILVAAPGFPQDSLGCFSHILQDAAAFETVDCLDYLSLDAFAAAFELDQDARNAGEALLGIQRGEDAAEVFDLDVAVAGVAQLLGDLPDRTAPSAELFASEAVAEDAERGPQTPRGDPGSMDELDIRGGANANELFGKLLCLPTNVAGREQLVA
jgi:hypothetical protein